MNSGLPRSEPPDGVEVRTEPGRVAPGAALVYADRLDRIVMAASAAVLLLGGCGLIGWAFDIALLKTVIPGAASMKANTAACFILLAASLWLQLDGASARRAVAARALAGVAAAVGVLTLAEYGLGVDFGIDQLLVQASSADATTAPGRMSHNTALSFACLGVALVLLDGQGRWLRSVSQLLGLLVLVIAFVAVAGYAYSVHALIGVAGYASMAVHTAVGFGVLATGLLVSRPQRGVIAVIAQDNRAGAALRRLLPSLALMPPLLGWLVLEGQRLAYYGPEFGLAIMATVGTVILAVVSLSNAHIQGAADAVSEQVRRDERFLFEFGELLRASVNASDALFDAAAKFGRYIGASRCHFNQVDTKLGVITTHRDYCDGQSSTAGMVISLSHYPVDAVADARGGRTIVVADASVDPKTAKDYDRAYRPLGLRARIAVPLLRDGEWVATFLVSTHVARQWQPREVALAEAVAERTWLWFEHLDAMDQLRRSDARNEAIVRSAFDAIVSMDERGRIVEFNPAAERLFGHARSDVLHKSVADVLVPESLRESHESGMATYLKTGHGPVLGKVLELPALRADGTEFPVELAITRVEAAPPPLFTGFFRDVSERRRAERTIREREARFGALVDVTAQIVWTTNAEGAVVEDSPSWRAYTGQSFEDWMRTSGRDVVHPEDRANMVSAWASAVEHKTTFSVEYRLRHVSGEWRWTLARAAPLLREDGTVREWVGMNSDITEVKRRDAELHRSNAELEQFAYVASHDLQEPLRMVASYTELLAQRYQGKLDEKADKYIHYASDGARRMQRLVSDLLEYSRVGSQGKPLGPIESERVIEVVLRGLRQLITETHATIEHSDLPRVMADELQLAQLFQNLLSNAIKFRGDAPPRVVIGAVLNDGVWTFSVADNGIGIDMQFATRIFQMFQRLHERGRFEGSGIGLAIAKRIVERHGGRIWGESKPGEGTTFYFTLAAAK